jgi:hypothetical protein
MEGTMKGKPGHDGFDLNELLRPAQAFAHPGDVVGDPDLTLNEKRAILSAWAAQSCARDAVKLREDHGSGPVEFDDVIDALRALDREENQPLQKYQRLIRRRRILDRTRMPDDRGNPLQ